MLNFVFHRLRYLQFKRPEGRGLVIGLKSQLLVTLCLFAVSGQDVFNAGSMVVSKSWISDIM